MAKKIEGYIKLQIPAGDVYKRQVYGDLIAIPAAFFAFAGITKAAQMPFNSWLLGAMVAPKMCIRDRAKGLNCISQEESKPCGKCSVCMSIKEGTYLDVVEIDAASNNGVDNIRELRESIKYPPASGRKKVYIIDEVHMLSSGAFNALLKTLEEPPEYVVFILATTEPQKLPATILSRCMLSLIHI